MKKTEKKIQDDSRNQIEEKVKTKSIRFNGLGTSHVKKIAEFTFGKNFVALNVGKDEKSTYIVLSKTHKEVKRFKQYFEINIKIAR